VTAVPVHVIPKQEQGSVSAHALTPTEVFSQRQVLLLVSAINSATDEHCAAASPAEVPLQVTSKGMIEGAVLLAPKNRIEFLNCSFASYNKKLHTPAASRRGMQPLWYGAL
jgi:hypothetical protein